MAARRKPAAERRDPQALVEGAKAHGFDTDLWTLDRVATVIWRLTGVRHHPAHVWRLLRRRLDWSLQRPARPPSSGPPRGSPPPPPGWGGCGPAPWTGPCAPPPAAPKSATSRRSAS